MIFIAISLFLTFLVIIVLVKGIRIVSQSEVMLIERFGNYTRTLTSGLNFVIPVIDSPREIHWQKGGKVGLYNRIDMREMVLDIPEQTTITKDNVSLNIDAVLYMQIIDAQKAAYEVAHLPHAIGQLAQTTLRSVIGELDLDETLASRDQINHRLKNVLDDITDKWGVNVNRVELANVTPPKEVQEAMEKQMQAERERRAVVLEASGEKEARIARSEGERQEKINQAQGEKEALIHKAEGEAQAILTRNEAEQKAIEIIKQALGNNAELAAKYLIAKKYIEAYKEFTHGEGDKVYLPFEASNAMASFGNLGDMFQFHEDR